MSMNDCIFCKIVNNEMPSNTIYEDDLFKVILDRFPSSTGHALIITKKHYENIFELADNEAEKIVILSKKIAKSLKSALNCDGLNIIQNNGKAAGQTVSHYHMHIIPRYENDEMGLSWKTTDPSDEAFKAVIEKIKLQ